MTANKKPFDKITHFSSVYRFSSVMSHEHLHHFCTSSSYKFSDENIGKSTHVSNEKPISIASDSDYNNLILDIIIIWLIHFMFKISIKNLKERKETRLQKQRLFFKIFSHFMERNALEEISKSFTIYFNIFSLFY